MRFFVITWNRKLVNNHLTMIQDSNEIYLKLIFEYEICMVFTWYVFKASVYISLAAYWFAKLNKTLNVKSRLWDSLKPACSRNLIRLLSFVDASFALSKESLTSPRLFAKHDSSISSFTYKRRIEHFYDNMHYSHDAIIFLKISCCS